MSLRSTHPGYASRVNSWRQMRDCFEGNERIKAAGDRYLFPTPGMVADGYPTPGARGSRNYDSYRGRATFPGYVRDAVQALVGIMHRRPATITLPPELEYLRAHATSNGEPLDALLRKVNEAQLIAGRCGLLGDVVDRGPRKGNVYLALYDPECAINWDDRGNLDSDTHALNLVVLDESGQRREGFEWVDYEAFRVLEAGDGDGDGPSTYRVTIAEGANMGRAETIVPEVGGVASDELQFTFINVTDITPHPEPPPLLALSDVCLTIYRGDADYRQTLFALGQDTLVVIGNVEKEDPNAPIRLGAEQSIILGLGGDAKMIGINSDGVPEQRAALTADHKHAENLAGTLLSVTANNAESGEALKVRIAARTATVALMSITGAFGLEEAVKKLARWVGADENKVKITPNLDFSMSSFPGSEALYWMQARAMGFPVSLRTLHDLARRAAVTPRTLEDEVDLIDAEVDLLPSGASTDPDGPAGDAESQIDTDDGDVDPEDGAPNPADKRARP